MRKLMPLFGALFGLGPMGMAIHIWLRLSGAKMNAAEPYALAFHSICTAAFFSFLAIAFLRRREQ